ncbi:Obg-like ATPase 1 [Eumeta japonica]|uniref:Obg-like ATPase 1 n=1 Tax=Eumeta variegata TaxID=151549 RepID=A0A4C1SES3_EUMVA|nr:Obg-like ATPase 1 [Eumeta japonica]
MHVHGKVDAQLTREDNFGRGQEQKQDPNGPSISAAEGQGLGNAFLSHINACDAIFHLCRAFDDPDVTHVEGEVDPISYARRTKWLIKIKEWVDKHDPGATIIPFSGAFEHALAEKTDSEKIAYENETKCKSQLDKIIVTGYKALQLEYFLRLVLMRLKPGLYRRALKLLKQPVAFIPILKKVLSWLRLCTLKILKRKVQKPLQGCWQISPTRS